MTEFKFPLFCCNKEMKEITSSYSSNTNKGKEKSFLCLDCGNIEIYKLESTDDKELLNLLENLKDDEIKESKIYKELKGLKND